MKWAIRLSYAVCGILMFTNLVSAQEASLEAFQKLPPTLRAERFQKMSPEEKSTLKRAQATDWVNRHRGELSDYQMSVVKEAIEFLSPSLYASPQDPTLRKQEERLKSRLTCALGRDRVAEAFSLLPAAPRDRIDRGVVDEWLNWFADCVLRSY